MSLHTERRSSHIAQRTNLVRRELQALAGTLSVQLLHDVVAEQDLETIRRIALAGAEFVLHFPAGERPTRLPKELEKDIVELSTSVDPEASGPTRHEALQDAFRSAAETLVDRARAGAVAPHTIRHWLGVLAVVEELGREVRMRAVRSVELRVIRRRRALNSLWLPALATDEAVQQGIRSHNFPLSALAPAATDTPRPQWTSETTSPVSVVVVKSAPDIGLVEDDLHVAPPAADAIEVWTPTELIIVWPTRRATSQSVAERAAAAYPASTVLVGMSERLTELGANLEWCRRAHKLFLAGGAPTAATALTRSGATIVDCSAMTLELLVGADTSLLGSIADKVLRPLADMTTYRKTILEETLSQWARHPGVGAPNLAKIMNKHPQTVRYRLRQLRDIYGDRLDDVEFVLLVRLATHFGPRSVSVS